MEMFRFKRFAYEGVTPFYTVTIWRLYVKFHRSDENYHSIDRQPVVKGWRLINLKRANGGHGTGHAFRLIKYWRTGAWWHLDLFWNRHHGN